MPHRFRSSSQYHPLPLDTNGLRAARHITGDAPGDTQAHEPTFVYRVTIGPYSCASEGCNKKVAKQNAARAAMAAIRNNGGAPPQQQSRPPASRAASRASWRPGESLADLAAAPRHLAGAPLPDPLPDPLPESRPARQGGDLAGDLAGDMLGGMLGKGEAAAANGKPQAPPPRGPFCGENAGGGGSREGEAASPFAPLVEAVAGGCRAEERHATPPSIDGSSSPLER